jgi:hypothetical protein
LRGGAQAMLLLLVLALAGVAATVYATTVDYP